MQITEYTNASSPLGLRTSQESSRCALSGSLGDATAFAEQEAMKAIVELLPATEENAIETGKVLDKLKEQDVKRTVATDALAKLISAGTIRRVGKGQRGCPYRYYKPTAVGEKDPSETQGEADE